MRRCAAASSAAAGRSSPSSSLAGLPWHEFVRRVAAAEADAERAAIVRAHRSLLRLPSSSAHPRERTRLAAQMNRLAAQMRTRRRLSVFGMTVEPSLDGLTRIIAPFVPRLGCLAKSDRELVDKSAPRIFGEAL